MKVVLPYLRIANEFDDFSSNRLDDVLREALVLSGKRPCYVEFEDDLDQYYLFFREKQIYSAGRIVDAQCTEILIKECLLAINQMQSPRAKCYEVNSKILHSLLILFQKKSSLKLLTSLVDLDEVLDKIEEEGKSCIVSATQDSFLAVLRYEKGTVTALCHEQSLPTPRESSFREDFLVKIYTLSAEKPLNICLYEDLLVKYATDAKMLDDRYQGDIVDLYLSKPPTVTLEFKGKEIGHWVLDKPVINIGRTAENDIVVDNLAVSRLHAVLEKDKGNFYIRDCDSLNGTLLNNNKVGRAKLTNGDEIVIGKHKLVFKTTTAKETPLTPDIAPFDQTVIIGPGGKPPVAMGARPRSNTTPRLVEKTKSGDNVFEIRHATLVMGKDAAADIEIRGMFIANRHAEIVHENGTCKLRHVSGARKVSVGGKTVKECVLKNNDAIRIGKREFIFRE